MSESIEFLSAVLITSKNAEKLADFYKNVIGLPLKDEQHGETEKHYGCELGDLHFAIHPESNFQGTLSGTGSIKLAFTVFNLSEFMTKVEAKGYTFAYPAKETGFSLMTAITDPDGNYIEFTQLSDWWFKHLEGRRAKGIDVITKWKGL